MSLLRGIQGPLEACDAREHRKNTETSQSSTGQSLLLPQFALINHRRVKSITDYQVSYKTTDKDRMTICLRRSRAVSISRRHTAPIKMHNTRPLLPSSPITGGGAIKKGELVWIKWRYGKTYCEGIIRALNADGTFDIKYSHGIRQRSVPSDRIRLSGRGTGGTARLAARFLWSGRV